VDAKMAKAKRAGSETTEIWSVCKIDTQQNKLMRGDFRSPLDSKACHPATVRRQA
jgi:hypothetical protein